MLYHVLEELADMSADPAKEVFVAASVRQAPGARLWNVTACVEPPGFRLPIANCRRYPPLPVPQTRLRSVHHGGGAIARPRRCPQ